MKDRTIIIPCAGMGIRLGENKPKAIIDVAGKPLLIRLLEQIGRGGEDIRVVVGYKADEVINLAKEYRTAQITFIHNDKYGCTGTGESVKLACENARRMILTIDGDMVIHPEDMKKILHSEKEFIGGADISSKDPWMLQTYEDSGKCMVSAFSKCRGRYEWNGIAQIQKDRFLAGKGYHVFHFLEPNLPIEFMNIRSREIDTSEDRQNATAWIENGYK